MSEMSELFYSLRDKVAAQGVDVSSWKQEPEQPPQETPWWLTGDAGGGAAFEYEEAVRRTQVGPNTGAMAMGGMDIRPQF